MVSNFLLLEEPIRMASVLEPSKPNFFPAMTKIVGTLGPNSRSVEVISDSLKAGMSVARFDFSWGDAEFHHETYENLKVAIKAANKLCAVMLDTVGPELLIVNKKEHSIHLEANSLVILTPDQEKEATSNLLPINFGGLSEAVKVGDDIFIGQYLFTGSETTSVWLQVSEVKEADVVCIIKNSATLTGALYTLHVSQIHIDLPTLSDKDKEVISTWGVVNKIDFLSLSYTRRAEDVKYVRKFLSELGDLNQTQILAKIENVEGLTHLDEILQEANGIIIARGNLGIDLPPEKLLVNRTLYEKTAASGFGCIHFLLDASEQQLVTGMRAVGDECERFIYNIFQEKLLVNRTLYEKTAASGFGCIHFLLDASEQQLVHMPVEKSIDTLVRLGLVTKKTVDGQIGVQAVPCSRARAILQKCWNN
ncbi:pyruvate kinase, cytosolic isozyme-like [Dorcoceras hygrometricum]|uniref:Pyruvate kinase n=1 Tax=Dorcoceras hygrometricum TaxID=472368 RepID=A0A2Z7BNY8_9LAMI|nr:pyruvate kinase, cytosolic isozyme-like [Dorcoceras hygrometricum]